MTDAFMSGLIFGIFIGGFCVGVIVTLSNDEVKW